MKPIPIVEMTKNLTVPQAILIAAALLAFAQGMRRSEATYSFMPLGASGTDALRLNTHTGAIDACSFVKGSMNCGPNWPRQ